jgi:hypothetical protein
MVKQDVGTEVQQIDELIAKLIVMELQKVKIDMNYVDFYVPVLKLLILHAMLKKTMVMVD